MKPNPDMPFLNVTIYHFLLCLTVECHVSRCMYIPTGNGAEMKSVETIVHMVCRNFDKICISLKMECYLVKV